MIRVFLYLTILLLSFSCKTEKKFKNPKWLFGKWERINIANTTKETYEIWNTNFSGVSLSIKDNDTVFVEQMQVFESNDKKYFQIAGIDGKPSFFEFIEQTENSFTCVNSQNIFPEKIQYSYTNNNLITKVSNEDFEIDFIFKKIN